MSNPSDAMPRRWLRPNAALNRFKPPPGMTSGIAAAERQPTRYGFRVGGIGFLVGQGINSEVMDRAPIYPLPKAPIWMAGLVNLRGDLAPVFDLNPVLELDVDEIQKQRHVLILGRGDTALGLLIDGLPRPVTTCHALPQLPPLPTAIQAYISKAYAEDQSIWLEFDHRSFFGSISALTNLTA